MTISVNAYKSATWWTQYSSYIHPLSKCELEFYDFFSDDLNKKPYDSQVEYIGSTGTQYIDTGIKGSDITRFVIDGSCQKAAETTNGQFLGGTSSANTAFFGATYENKWYCYSGSSFLGVSTNKSYIDATINPNTGGTFIDEVTNTSYTFTKISDNPSWGFENVNLRLFGGASIRRSPNAKCYSLKLYTSEGLVRDFVPVRVGTTGYLYDKVTKQLFGNAGTGSLVVGEDIVPVEYLESSGTQYIDTGLMVKQNMRIVFTVIYTQTVSSFSKAWGFNSSSYEIIWGYNNRFYFGGGYTENYASPSQDVEYNMDYDLTSGNMVAKVNGNIVRQTTGTQETYSGIPIFIFAMRSATSGFVATPYKAKHKAFQIYDNGTLVRDFIPVRVGTTGYMYDKVSKRMFGNVGTEDFILGPDKWQI